MHTTIHTLAWALVFAGAARADTTTADAAYDGDDVVTSYYTWCPDETSTTTDVAPSITADPAHLTMTGDDGRTTIYRTETTILPHMCPGNDGVCGATYTLSQECPCKAEATTTASTSSGCPEGFTTTVVPCTVCANNGGPMTVTLTTPKSDGPYATVTPSMGSPVNNPADISSGSGSSSSNTDTAPQQTDTPSNSDNTNADTTAANSDTTDSQGATKPTTGAGEKSNTAAPSRWANNGTTPQATQYRQPYAGGATRMGATGGLNGYYTTLISAGAIGVLALML